MSQHPLIIILGPTASGKTALAVRLAAEINGEIISADSRQVFNGMDIGTGKDLNEYGIEEKRIPYHLIDIKQAGEDYNVNEFKEDFYRVFREITARKAMPILCGGTGMYVHSILQNHEYTTIPVNQELRAVLIGETIESLKQTLSLYPRSHTSHADVSSHKRLIRAIEIAEYLQMEPLIYQERPAINTYVVGLSSVVLLRRKKIEDRLNLRFETGMIEEVERLLENGVPSLRLKSYGLEYKFIVNYLEQKMTLAELKERLYFAICQFAKRQMTFFRKMEKDGVLINWFDTSLGQQVILNKILDAIRKQYFI